MFRFLKRRSSKKRSVLDKQKVSRKSGREAPSLLWSIAAKALVVVLLLVIVWGLGLRALDSMREFGSYINSLAVLTPVEWRIEVISQAGTPLPEDVRREVYKVASRSLKTGSPTELSQLAKQVEGLGMVDTVKVIRPLADTVILSAEMRRPALLVAVGSKTRFMALDGTVFGDAADNSGNPSGAHPTVVITGIFDQRTNPGVDASLRVVTTAEERKHLLDALDVWQRSGEAGVDVKQVSFQKFRGYSIALSDDTEITIGLKPFDYKLKKLRGILDGLKRDGVVAARIELDYEGKAFIKERKL